MVGTAEDYDSDVDMKDDQARLHRQMMEQKKKESIDLHLGTLVHAVVCPNTPENPCKSALCARIKVRSPHHARAVQLPCGVLPACRMSLCDEWL